MNKVLIDNWEKESCFSPETIDSLGRPMAKCGHHGQPLNGKPCPDCFPNLYREKRIDEVELGEGVMFLDDFLESDVYCSSESFTEPIDFKGFVNKLKAFGVTNLFVEITESNGEPYWNGCMTFQLPCDISLGLVKIIVESDPREFEIREDVLPRAVRLWWD